ncbi:MAG: cupredoxin domain-containing protein [Thermomicrobiales bacterium]
MRGSNKNGAAQRVTAAVACALLLAGLITFARPAPVGAAVTVTMQNVAFVPGTVTVSVGMTVTWTNRDSVIHTTTSDTAVWDSNILNTGASFSFTFTKAGTFAYHCNVHPSMHGTITVTPAVSPTATTPPPTATSPAPTVRPPTATVRATATATMASTATAAANTPAATAPGTPIAAPASATNPDPIQPGPVSALAFANFVEPLPPFTDTPDHRFFAATNHTLNFGFKSFWEQNGGLALFGYPISEEFLERGADGVIRTVQYFERARFEYHYDLPTLPYEVEMGMLSRETTAGRLTEPPFLPVGPDAATDGQFFPETGHTLSGQFAAFWQANGGLPIFGYPISEPFTETGADGVARTVQYFERYRFEYHAESGTVELGRLGVQIAQTHGYLPAG